MSGRLTLYVGEDLVKRAKRHSRKIGKSVSQLVADYFALLDRDRKKNALDSTPITRSLKGVLKSSRLSKKEYLDYLEDKYR